MLKEFLSGLLSGVVAAMPACDSISLPKLKPGISKRQDVEDIMGPPTMEWKDADGSVTWEYPRTPNGVVNYMIVFGPNGVLREVRQVLTEENFAKVSPGMSREDIRRLLGQPAKESYFSLKKEYVWDWRKDDPMNMTVYFNVHFDESGRVIRTSTNVEPRH